MKSENLLTASLDDIIFANRNKDYGAYELRQHYPVRIFKGILVTVVIVLFAFAASFIARSVSHKPKMIKDNGGVIITAIVETPPEEILPKPPKIVVPVQTVAFNPPRIVEDEDYHDPPPDQDMLAESLIGDINLEGEKYTGIPNETQIDSTGVIEGRKEIESNSPFIKVEVEAKFPGNWIKFLERNLDADVPIRNAAPEGRYTIEIRFVVDIDGSVSDITPMTQLGFGMEDEAVRVLKKASKWEPAIQNGNKVKAYRLQRITFQVLADS